jgi:tetratricopeptide (TPR) repeat protein
MTKRKDPEPPVASDDDFQEVEPFDPYAVPDELAAAPASPRRAGRARDSAAAPRADVELDFGLESAPPPPRQLPKAAIAIAVAAIVAGALFAYRTASRKKALRAAVAQAELDLRFDTADGYLKASAILAPFASQDPMEAGSVRAYALGMLALDYRDPAAAEEAEGLLVKPERAEPIPRWGSLARAAVALSKGEAGTAMTAASRVADDPLASTMEGRIALTAGNLEAALEPLHGAAAADPPIAAALALHGDAVRRAKRDYRAAQAAYARALSSSPAHPRAAYGLAKLALMGQVPPAEATAALDRIIADPATPPNERGRAALHAAALAIRAGDRSRAKALLDGAALDAPARDWAERAAELESDTGRTYRAIQGAPAALLSASDEDPPEVPPIAIASAPPQPHPKATASKAAKPPAKSAGAKAAASRKKGAAKKAGARR